MHIETYTAHKDERAERLARLVSMGFNSGEISSVAVDRLIDMMIDNKAVVTEMCEEPNADTDPLWSAGPVGTFVRIGGSVNLGAGPIPADLITAVTVRPTHKRRGILRQMMEKNLRDLAAGGSRLALLTASSAALYGRYGFKDVVDWGRITVDTLDRFRLRVEPAGTVEMVGVSWLWPQIPDLFDQFHSRTAGSVSRFLGYYAQEDFLDDKGEPEAKLRAAIHRDQHGEIDGYVVYWITDTIHIHIKDFITMTPDAELGLWQFLASIEPAQDIQWVAAHPDSLLKNSLVDRRVFHADRYNDGLWARIFTPTVLEDRPYGCQGTVDFTVEDPLGFASGDWRLEVSQQGASVQPGPGGMTVSVRALAALAFGSASPVTLADTGEIVGMKTEDRARLNALFAPTQRAQFLSSF